MTMVFWTVSRAIRRRHCVDGGPRGQFWKISKKIGTQQKLHRRRRQIIHNSSIF